MNTIFNLFAVFVLGFALGYVLAPCKKVEEIALPPCSCDKFEENVPTLPSRDKVKENSPPLSSCQNICTTSVKFLAFVYPVLNAAFRLVTLIPKTELACERICLASNVIDFAKGSL